MNSIRRTNPSRGEVVRHRVRNELQKMILDGVHRPGTKLLQKDIADRYGVAQGVVREALIELQAFGLVETIDNRGMYVSDLTAETLLDSFDVRAVHEGLAARLCCEHATRTQIRGLRELADEILALGSDSNTAAEMAAGDRELHHSLIQISGNGMLSRLADNYLLLGKVVRANRNPKAVHKEHLAILKAIEDGKPDLAERLSREHIMSGKEAVAKKLKLGSFWAGGDAGTSGG